MKPIELIAGDGLKLSVALFEAEHPKGLVQIIHGSVEHKERYYDFCNYLMQNGFTVIISDNRGHGASVNASYPLGYMDIWQKIVDDQYEITQYIRTLHPNLPLSLFGHSLGSVFARCYLEKHDNELQKLILSGTVNYHFFTPMGIALAHLFIAIAGNKGYSYILRKAAMNCKNISWVSYSQTNIAQYKADPLCYYPYPNRSILTIFEATRELKEIGHYQCKNPDLPIMSISGKDDPVTGGTRGLQESFRLLHEIGYHNFTNKVYPHMKHEVIHEKDYELVYKYVLDFLSDTKK